MPRTRRSPAAAFAVTAVLAMTAAACGPGHPAADAKPTPAATSLPASPPPSAGPHLKLPSGLPTSWKDLEGWRGGDWKKWARAAADFVNPVIKDLWKPDRMSRAKEVPRQIPPGSGQDQGVTDPPPASRRATAVKTPYHYNAAPVGKVFFDGPQGPMVCSGTVVEDPARPGKSNLVWTAGHCVHSGAKGGWYRDIAFVPAYNDRALPASAVRTAPGSEVSPYGAWWADWAQTSNQWISTGAESGGRGSAYDFAVLHVRPENGGGKSLEETVGAALPVWFDAPYANGISSLGAWGYPAAPPFDGQRMFDCVGRPGRLSLDVGAPTEYRLGCTMTGGSSGGGWFAKEPGGQVALISNTSVGPDDNTWLAGPHLGSVAKGIYRAVSGKFADE